MKKYFSLSKKPLVSIVTTSFNSGNYIEECIESILIQDYPFIEHVIQDGDSTDYTKQVLKKYSSKKYKSRVKIFIEPDKGQADGLNRAIQKAKGEIILVLNADDLLMPYAVSWGVENFHKYKDVGVIYGDEYVINESGEITRIYQAHEYDFEKLICVELVPPAQAAFIRRSALVAVGFWADKNLDTCPDYEIWVRLAQKFPMKHVFGVITKYRRYKSPPLDSKKQKTVSRFVKAKMEVMDRLFDSPKTPERIKRLKTRAYANLYWWASQEAFEMGSAKLALYYMIRSYLKQPSSKKFFRIRNKIIDFAYLFMVRILKASIKNLRLQYKSRFVVEKAK